MTPDLPDRQQVETLIAAINTALHESMEDNTIPLEWFIIVEAVNANGTKSLRTITSEHMTVWAMKGMLDLTSQDVAHGWAGMGLVRGPNNDQEEDE